MVAPTPRVPPSFSEIIIVFFTRFYDQEYVSPWCEVFRREKSCEASLEHIRAAADGVRGVAVVRALP